MEDHQIVTIEQLRLVIKELTRKLEIRTHMLSDLVPHIIASEITGEDIDSSIIHEWAERHLRNIEEFNEEYSKEIKIKLYKDK